MITNYIAGQSAQSDAAPELIEVGYFADVVLFTSREIPVFLTVSGRRNVEQ
jgi:hypothetical protein